MDIILLFKAALMGIVEGVTEFLPISSTGHLILASSLLGFHGETAKVFDIAIQTGAMFAVIWQYRIKLAETVVGAATQKSARRFILNVGIAFAPAVMLGLAFGSFIKSHLFSAVPVACAFILGAIIILVVERKGESEKAPRVADVDAMTWRDALGVGLLQCLALIPGTSRSGASIIGGMVLGLSRRTATEFSFYLGIPTLMGAGAYSVWKQRDVLNWGDLPMFAVGLVFAFASALICIRWLIAYISTHDFRWFAWYRIGFGLLILATAYTGVINWSE